MKTRTQSNAEIRSRQQLRASLLVLAAVTSACATSDATRPAPVEIRDERGFTIKEEVRAGLGVRSDFSRAMRLLEGEEYERGIELLLEVTEAAPTSTAAHIDLSIAYGRVDDLERAEASIKQALELNPRHPVAYNELGILYRRTGRFGLARESYETALELYPEFHFARRNLAILCDLFLKDVSCAIENYELYAEAVPDDEKAAMWIADLRNRAGK
jgi:Flp pilus assembly protein TadD